MKKIIAVTAGLLLVGSVGVASAEVVFTGDARERLLMMEKYTSNNSQSDYNYGRIRLGILATAKGGAYINARLILTYNDYGDGMGAPISPGGTTIAPTQLGSNGNVNNNSPLTDYAYIGMPIGPVTVNAGRMPDNTDVWFRFDKRADRVAATWANKTTSVTAQFDKINESLFQSADAKASGVTISPDPSGAGTEDRDVNQWGVVAKQQFGGGWSALLYGIYQDDQQVRGTWYGKTTSTTTTTITDVQNGQTSGFLHDLIVNGQNVTGTSTSTTKVATAGIKDNHGYTPDGSGFQGTLKVEGPAGPVKLMGELSFAQKDLATASSTWYISDMAPRYYNPGHSTGAGSTFDDGYGGIFHAKMSSGPVDGTLAMGFTKNGFVADGNYGFLMIGGAMGGTDPAIPNVGSPITAVGRVGALPSSSAYAADTYFAGLIGDYTVNKTIKLVGILADANVDHYGNLVELSGLVNFAVSDGAYINVGGGMLFRSLDKDQNSLTYNPVGSATYNNTHDDTAYGVFTELGIKF